MIVNSPQEVFNLTDVIRDYIRYVETGGSVETFGGEMVEDPKRAELIDAPIVFFSPTEEIIARRGLWRHLGIIYRGIKKSAKTANTSAIPRVTHDIVTTVDDYRVDAQRSIGRLKRAHDYDEDIWLPQTAYENPGISQELAYFMLALKTKCPIDLAEQLDLNRRAQSYRQWFWKAEIGSLALDLERGRAHPGLIKLAEAIEGQPY